jgi:AmiR/NasT family two-component response regulator
MRLREHTIGALNLFQAGAGGLAEADVVAGQAMADVATIGILQERALVGARVLAEQLQSALNSRVVIEQAKGMVAAGADVPLEVAFRLLRAHARSNNVGLSEVAARVLDGRLPVAAIVPAPPKG